MTPADHTHPDPTVLPLSRTPLARLIDALNGPGLWLDVGAATLRIRSPLPLLASQIQAVYPHFPFRGHGEWSDADVVIEPVRGLRRWIRPQIELSSDGQVLFEPFPADSPLPLMEWGCNWLIGQRMNHLLLFHAGALERNGHALLLPALPGSGKSTLSAALSQRGWRLMSDEFGAFDPGSGALVPILKPAALKNESIDVMRRFEPTATLGPSFPRTRKGTVAHLAAAPAAVARRHESATPGAVVLPRWKAGSPTVWEDLPPSQAFSALAFNAFNYTVLGAEGLDAALDVARQCPAWSLTYSDLDDAIASLNARWPHGARHA